MPLDDLFDDVTTKTERDATIRIARERCGYAVSEIAMLVGLSIGRMSRISRNRDHQKAKRKT